MRFSFENLPQPLCLIGMPGAGKSYWAHRWAAETSREALDLDNEITRISRKSIPQIFAAGGESAFRKTESEALRLALLSGKTTFLATGGGTPCFGDNLQRMLQTGTVIYLDTPLALLAARILAQGKPRPLLDGLPENALLQALSRMLTERSAFYQQAHYTLAPEDLASVTFAAL